MKKKIKLYAVIIMTVVISLSQEVAASEHVKMCDYNNTWVYYSYAATMYDVRGNTGLTFMRFAGEKEVNGKVYHEFKAVRTLFRAVDGTREYGPSEREGWLFREEGDKVWCCTRPWEQPDETDVLMYDFGINTGDPFPGQGIDGCDLSEEGLETVVFPDTILGGTSRKMYAPRVIFSQHLVEMRCIEGIGPTWGFLPGIYTGYLPKASPDDMSPDEPGQRCTLTAVYDDSGKFLYGDPEEFNNILNIFSGIATIQTQTDIPIQYYNLQGQRISAPEKGQPCIERRGGTSRKIIM